MRFSALVLVLFVTPGFALTPEAMEFLEISKKLEPVQCEKRKLRRAIVMAEVEKRDADARKLKKKFSILDRNPESAKLEKRLGELERRILDAKGNARDPEDLQAISFQQREAFYRCD